MPSSGSDANAAKLARQALLFLLLALTARVVLNAALARAHLPWVPAFASASDILPTR